MNDVFPILAGLVALVVVVPVLVVGVIFLAKPVFKGLAWLITHIVSFIGSEIADLLRAIGAIITSLVLVPITLFNVLIGRWSSSAHYGRAIEAEMKSVLGCLYRVVIGNPARLLMLTPLTEGLEKRVPAAVAHAPGSDRPSRRQGQFDGYTIIGSLPGGGSGSKLYVATPDAQKLAALAKMGQTDVDRVVIKSFSLSDGSTLPQIVRENRALPAAKRLGLILEHDLTEDRFYYITRYVPGESLGITTTRLHALCGGGGLTGQHLADALDYAADVVRTLHTYHSGGLWHKDVKPDNIIVSDGQAHLVDFGLVTPLRSSMTLTTHGTEYFRDPEMVRMALRGVKVHEVDGAKFDVYAAGAVLYSIVENSFPAHGGLSQISRRCPEAVRWIVRRAMADYDKRYESAAVMLQDLEAVLAAPDPFMVRPADLPSMRAGDMSIAAPFAAPDIEEVGAARVGRAAATPALAIGPRGAAAGGGAWSSASPSMGFGALPLRGGRVPVRVTSWWTGKYALVPHPSASASPRMPGATAAEQLGRARDRARSARERARERLASVRGDYPGGVNKGIGFSLALLIVVTSMVVLWVIAPNVMKSANQIVRTQEFGAAENLASVHDDVADAMSEMRHDIESMSEDLGVLPVLVERAPKAPVPPAPPSATLPPASGASGRKGGQAAGGVPGAPDLVGPMPPIARVLVLKDHMTFSAEDQKRVDAQIQQLDKAGILTMGVLTEPSPQTDEETRMMAELRAEIGLSAFKSAEARDHVQAWLATHPDIDAIVWIDQGDDGKPGTWVIQRPGLESGVSTRIEDALRGRRRKS